jgi:hypothetical protein
MYDNYSHCVRVLIEYEKQPLHFHVVSTRLLKGLVIPHKHVKSLKNHAVIGLRGFMLLFDHESSV